MRLLKVTTAYPSYWKGFYAARPGLELKGYVEQKAALDFDGFGWADFWSRAFKARGWEALDLTAMVEPLDDAFRRDEAAAGLAALEICALQVKRFAPDVLWVDDYNNFSPAWIRELRAACPSIRLVLGWCGAPYPDAKAFAAYDLILSCVPELVADFRSQGMTAEPLMHAFEPDMLRRLGPLPARDISFSFVGQVLKGNRYHESRQQLLEFLVARTPLELYMPAKAHGPAAALKHGVKLGFWGLKRMGLPVPAKVAAWRSAPAWEHIAALEPRRKGEVYALEMARVMARSRLTLNKHIDLSANSASNMRLFESTGMGACLLTDAKANLAAIFEPGKEVIAYDSAQDCAEKAAWLLSHDAEREAIAAAGQARTLRDHTIEKRAELLEAMILERLA